MVEQFNRNSSSLRSRSSATRTAGARILAISGSFSDPIVEEDVAAQRMLERIMAILAVAFVVLMIWRFVKEWKN
jgi:hypothetical protein